MKFTYEARTRQGEIQKGTVEADSKKEALNILEKYGLYATGLKETKKLFFLQRNIGLGRKVSLKDVLSFTRQLAVMLKAATPPVEALRSQVEQIQNREFREKILEIAEKVETGNPLSRAFSFYPDIFNSFFVSVIKSGEASGKMAQSLDYLADHLEREYNLRASLTGAMIYPAFVVAVFVMAFFLVMFFIVPKMTKIFEGFGGQLPFSTKVLISLSNFVKGGGWILGIVLIGVLAAVFTSLKKSKAGRNFWYKFSLKIPIIGPFYKKVYLSQFAENLSVLIAAGLPITQALKMTKEIINNTLYKNVLEETEERVARGERISKVLTNYAKLFPPFLNQMIATGERTGELGTILQEVVEFYQAEIKRFSDNLSNIMEPVLLLFLGGGIGVLAVSIFLPLFKIGIGGMSGM